MRRKEPKKCLPPPAVTICAITNELMGWNRTDTDVFGLDHCEGEEDLEECVEKFTFTLDDLLRNSRIVTNSKEKNVMMEKLGMSDTKGSLCKLGRSEHGCV